MNMKKTVPSIAVAMVMTTIVIVMNVGVIDASGMRAMNENVRFMDAETPEPTSIIVKYTGTPAPYFEVVEASEDKSIEELIDEYNTIADVSYAEPNHIVHIHIVPDDPFYLYQWHLDNPVYGGINAECAWNISTGNDVVVAVLDTGVAYEDYGIYLQAPDLAGTSFVQGYNFVNNDSHPNDDHAHGTHVAGTVAQTTNNGEGVAGVAFNCSIMPVKVVNETGYGTDADVAEGIIYATDNGADIISMSFGGPDCAQTLRDAVDYAHSHGVILIASAGNDGPGSPPNYPAACDHVIGVGATTYDEEVAYYASTGWWVDIAAPGGDVTVDRNADGYADGILQQTFVTGCPTDFGYWFYQGTSMACPHVSGVAALLLADGANPTDVEGILTSTAEDHGETGWDGGYGWGIVDACAALGKMSYNPLDLSEGDCVDDCVDTGDTIAYTICHNNLQNPYRDVHNATMVDELPADVTFDSASDGGIYHAGTHTVTWDIGTVLGSAQEECVMLNVTVNTGTEGTMLTNCCTIDGDETEPTTVCEDTEVCEAAHTPTPEPVPTLTPSGLTLLIGLMTLVGLVVLRRRE